MNKKSFNTSIFIAIGGGLFIVLIITIAASGGFTLPEGAGGWLYEYQTLLSGLLAASSIVFTWMKYYNGLKRKRFWARGHLPDAVDNICAYAQACFVFVRQYGDGVTDNKPPARCDDAVQHLKNAIEWIDNDSAEYLFELLSFYQVHNARLNSFLNDSAANRNDTDRLYDSVKLYCVAIGLFDYARGRQDEVTWKKQSLQSMMGALRAINGHSAFDAFLALQKKIKNSHK
ncbi:MAG: hypothetical protein ACRBDL_08060 [Alphaproteobacteria bacterium]